MQGICEPELKCLSTVQRLILIFQNLNQKIPGDDAWKWNAEMFPPELLFVNLIRHQPYIYAIFCNFLNMNGGNLFVHSSNICKVFLYIVLNAKFKTGKSSI